MSNYQWSLFKKLRDLTQGYGSCVEVKSNIRNFRCEKILYSKDVSFFMNDLLSVSQGKIYFTVQNSSSILPTVYIYEVS